MARESGELQRLQAQRQKVQDALDELDQQKASLEEQLSHIRQQTSQETHLVGGLVECSFHDRLIYFNTGTLCNNRNDTSVAYIDSSILLSGAVYS